MSLRETIQSLLSAGRRAASLGLVGLALAAAPASAYVVITADNRVFDVPTRPELSGDLVLFTLDSIPVSLRSYEVNLRATNEINGLMDQGVSGREVMARLAALPGGVPVDQRLVASSSLHSGSTRRAGRAPSAAPGPYAPPPATGSYESSRASSPFAAEAQQAMREAERRSAPPPTSYAAPPRAYSASSSGGSDRVADLDAEIAAEQAYLRQLTAGEVVVDDLDREIQKSMDKVARLQRKRQKVAAKAERDVEPMETGMMPPARQSMPEYRGIYPPGSREGEWERELAEARGHLQQLRAQASGIPAGGSQEREMLDEQAGETEHRIRELERKLERAGR